MLNGRFTLLNGRAFSEAQTQYSGAPPTLPFGGAAGNVLAAASGNVPISGVAAELHRDLSVIVNADADKASRSSDLPSRTSITHFQIFRLKSDTNNFACLFAIDNGVDQFQQLCMDSDGTTLRVFDGFGASVTIGAITVGDWYAVAYSSDGTTLRAWLKNLSTGSAVVAVSSSAAAGAITGGTMYVGGDGFAEVPDAAIRSPMTWRVAWTLQSQFEAQMNELEPVDTTSIDSWFHWDDSTAERMETDRSGNGRHLTRGAGTWAVDEKPPVGAVEYTLTADSGNVGITGTAANLERAAEVAAAAGSVPITGTDAALRKGITMAADAGAVPINGTAASLERAAEVAAAAGSVAITGTAANLERSLRLTAAAGAVPIVGTAASVELSREVAAAPGSVSISGTAASLELSRRLVAAAGALPINGTAANLERAAEVAAASANVPITGTDASLVYSAGSTDYTLTADPGSVPINGTAATTRTARELAADQGAIGISGTPANLERALRLSAAAGAVPIAGPSTTLRADRPLQAAPGSVSISGTAATLRLVRALVAAPGSVPISAPHETFLLAGTPPFQSGGGASLTTSTARASSSASGAPSGSSSAGGAPAGSSTVTAPAGPSEVE